MKTFVRDNKLNKHILKNEIHTFLNSQIDFDNNKIDIGICQNPNQIIFLYEKQSKIVVKLLIWTFVNEHECQNVFDEIIKNHSELYHNKPDIIIGKNIYVVVLF